MLHIAFAKGRIAKTVMKNLAAAGFNFPTYDDDSRKLIFTDETGMLKVTLVKSPDVVVYVERGAADAGVVGSDVIEEDGAGDTYVLLDLGIAKCRMAVAGIKGRQNVLEKRMITAASKYPRIARAYFESRHKSVDIIKLNGSVELAPLVGLSDVIVDIVETGSTLRENHLKVIEEFRNISARFIANKTSFKFENAIISDMMTKLREQIK